MTLPASLSSLPKYMWWLFLADAVLVLVHALLHTTNTFFSLDYEANLPTIYQTLKYFSFGYLGLGLLYLLHRAGTLTRGYKLFWGSLSALLIALGLDEIGQLHESVERFLSQSFPAVSEIVTENVASTDYIGSRWVYFFIPFVVAFLVAAVFWLRYAAQHYPRRVPVLALAFVLMLTIPVWEYIGSGGVGSWYPLFVVGEEYTEMTAISLLATFLTLEARGVHATTKITRA